MTTLQEIVGCLLYYGRAVDSSLLHEINKLGSIQTTATQAIKPAVRRLLEYARAYSDSELVFRKSNMHVIIQTDASYLSRPNSKSVAGCIIYFGDASVPTTENGAVFANSTVLDVVVSSAAEAEYGAAFKSGQQGINIRNIAIGLGHAQPATPILCDNKFAVDFANDTCKQRRSKAIDMRFHWLRDRIRQGQFTITHVPGCSNLADIFTKTLSVTDFQKVLRRLVQPPTTPTAPGFKKPYVPKHSDSLT